MALFKFETIIKLFSRKGRKFYFFVSHTVNYHPRDISLFEAAFVHRSYTQKRPLKNIANNERLEYLGDAILGAIVASVLYDKFPNAQEGSLTSIRSVLVSRKRLNQIAIRLNLCEHILSSEPNNITNTHIPGDVVEAIIAAIFIDKGFNEAKRFVARHIATDEEISHTFNLETAHNYKSDIMIWAQRNKQNIQFVTTPVTDDDGRLSHFESQITLPDGSVVASGSGHNKIIAEQQAAKLALENVENAKC
ncbi:MAG: ribonuclease III [Bacteroidales bacterium]|nr:ribonuclease III [Bacteroidales bacterium]